MSTARHTVALFAATLSALVAVIAGLWWEWPLWLWPVGVLLVPGLVWLALWVTAPSPERFPPDSVPQTPVPAPERREQQLIDVPLPTCLAEYDFLLTARVRWYPVDAPDDAPAVNPGALAIDSILNRARLVTAQHQPQRAVLLEHQLNGELGVACPDPDGRVEAMALDVVLRLRPEDEARLERLTTVRKNEEIFERERRYEQSRREYLSKDVLTSTGSAVVWWLAKHDDKIDKTVDDLGLLAELTAAARDDEIPERLRHLTRQPSAEPEPTPYDNIPHNDTWSTRIPPNLGDTLNGHSFNGFPSASPWGPDRAEEPEPPHSTDLFEEWLESINLTADDPRRRMFAATIARAADAAGEQATAQDLRARFDPPRAADATEEPTSEDPISTAPREGPAGGAGPTTDSETGATPPKEGPPPSP